MRFSFPTGTTNHPLNKSKKRKILVSIWDFGVSHPQSERSHYLHNDHPAKMRPSLARAILQIYGESPVLDPMCGIGTTCVEASLLGMQSFGVDYEQKFVDQANKNIKHLRKLYPNKKLGKATIVRGDARFLSQIFRKKASSIVFSPPYFNAIKKGGEGPNADNKKINYKERIKRFQGYSADKGNIGNTSNYGEVFNSVVFSPPYFDAVNSVSTGHQGPELGGLARQHRLAKEGKSGYSSDKGNISNCKDYGFFGSIIFSPPYCGVMDAKRHTFSGISARDPSLAKTGFYSKDESNLGNIRNYGENIFGSIIFSPPYVNTRVDQHNVKISTLEKACKELGLKDFRDDIKKVRAWLDANAKWGDGRYSSDGNNIGNTRKYGEFFNSIIFSPPFADSKHNYDHGLKKLGKSFKGRNAWEEKKNVKTKKDNVGNLKYGVFNSIVFSPPYSEGIGHVAGKNANEKFPWRLKLQRKMTETWSNGNIAKLKHGDNFFNSIVFSPPYGEANRGGGIAKKGYEGKYGKNPGLKDRCYRPLSEDKNNLTNTLYGRTYLGEMFKVYSECYKVLKPGKFMVVVVKDIRRKGLCIPVGADTIKLCQLASFELFDIIINRLYFPSFWQLHRAIKDQEEGVMHHLKTHEYVLVFRKPITNNGSKS